MKSRRQHKALISLTALAGVLALTAIAAPTFAWHVISLNTCVGTTWSTDCAGNPSYTIGSQVSDTANVAVSDNGGSAYITFTVYKAAVGATCAPTGDALYTSGAIAFPGDGSSHIVPTASSQVQFDSTGQSAGAYVWVTKVTYSDATPWTACEPFTLTPGTGVPQFPLGSLLVIALALPGLLLVRTRLVKANPSIQ